MLRGAIGDLLTTDHVVIESWFLFRARLDRDAVMRLWDALATGVVRVIGVTSADVVHARRIAEDWPDQDFSIVDCTNFAAMERVGIEEAFTVDRHFRVYRYGRSRRRSFRIVP